MKTQSFLRILFSVVASILVSLLAVWLVSEIFGFTFHPEIVVVLSVTLSAVAIAQENKRRKLKVR